jgi:hypothetical protein
MKEFVYFVSSYLTLWNILLIVLYINNIISSHGNSLLLLSTYVLIGGFYLHYIKPKYMIIPYFSKNGIILKDRSLLLVDIIYHIVPMIILCNFIRKKNIKLNNDCTLYIVILLIYNFFNSIEKRYRIDHIDCSIIYIITILIYRVIIKYNK